MVKCQNLPVVTTLLISYTSRPSGTAERLKTIVPNISEQLTGSIQLSHPPPCCPLIPPNNERGRLAGKTAIVMISAFKNTNMASPLCFVGLLPQTACLVHMICLNRHSAGLDVFLLTQTRASCGSTGWVFSPLFFLFWHHKHTVITDLSLVLFHI